MNSAVHQPHSIEDIGLWLRLTFHGQRFLYGLRGWNAERRVAFRDCDATGNPAVRTNDRFGKLHYGDHAVLKGCFGPVVQKYYEYDLALQHLK